MTKTTKAKIDKKLLQALHEFGYPSVTLEEVQEASTLALAGVDTGADVVKMLVKDWLSDAGVVPKSPK